MTLAIQKAYYLNARNPSDYETLIELAEEIGADKNKFSEDVISSETDRILKEEIQQCKKLDLNSLPSLLFINKEKEIRLQSDYLNANTMLNRIESSI